MQVETVQMPTHFLIVTPSFNQADFLPRTLDSVARQTGVTVQHVVVDPGSTDGSLDILSRRYGIHLVAKPDSCQSEGINNGFSECTGNYISWLNSDDMYYSADTLASVARIFEKRPDVDIVYGDAVFIGEDDRFLKDYYVFPHPDRLAETLQFQVGICQPAVFWRRHVYERLGVLDESYHFQLDYEYWIRMTQSGFRWFHLNTKLAAHRWWPGMKTASKRSDSLNESLNLVKQKFGYVHHKWAERTAAYEIEGADGIVNLSVTADPVATEKATADILRLCNTDSTTLTALKRAPPGSPAHITLSWMRSHNILDEPEFQDMNALGLDEANPAVLYPEDAPQPSRARRPELYVHNAHGHLVAYRVSPEYATAQSRKKFNDDQRRLADYLKQQQQANASRTCVVVANGPSLRKSLGPQLFEHDLIISNFAYKDDQLCKHAKYFTIVNYTVAAQVYSDWRHLRHIDKIFPFWLGQYIPRDSNTYYVNATVVPEFSVDATKYLSWRSTVSYFNMQLAYSLGYRTILLVGFDNSYVQPAAIKEGDTIHQTSDDPNHFMAGYFKGKTWQAADTDNMSESYLHALAFCLDSDCRIYNCTVGGRLEIFPRSVLSQNFCSHSPLLDSRLSYRKLSHTELLLAASRSHFRTFVADDPQRSFYDWNTIEPSKEYIVQCARKIS